MKKVTILLDEDKYKDIRKKFMDEEIIFSVWIRKVIDKELKKPVKRPIKEIPPRKYKSIKKRLFCPAHGGFRVSCGCDG